MACPIAGRSPHTLATLPLVVPTGNQKLFKWVIEESEVVTAESQRAQMASQQRAQLQNINDGHCFVMHL